MSSDGEKDGLETLLSQVIERNVVTNPFIQLELGSKFFNDADLSIQNLLWQSETARPYSHGPTNNGKGFKEGYRITVSSQLIGCHQTCGARAYNSHLFLFFRTWREVHGRSLFCVGEKTFQQVDGDGLVHISSTTYLFAGSGTEPACHPREWVLLTNKGQSLIKFPLRNESNVASSIHLNRTGGRTGSNLIFVHWQKR